MSLKVLALDAATESLSAAISAHRNKDIVSHFEVCPQEHSQKILPLIESLLTKDNIKLKDLDVIAFGRGPGSFTGVRISVAITQGLAFSANLPVVGISTLQTMAQQAIDETGAKNVYAAIDARMSEVYFAYYCADENGIARLIDKEIVIKPELLKLDSSEVVAVGTGFATYPKLYEADNIKFLADITLPNAKYMLKIASDMYNKGGCVSASQAQPMYVRDTVTWKKLPRKG
ncbi:tRNA (adenosine(37)-N6)-threonylcarbamoyltransferase complex dimerization subunit type 1 TsaB [Pseudoalteromonas sp. NBT06-2]|uniref:tRNA (adenosine(37)-N6)-threonylcarbamoyltransferase complex dimerization subunit type 1 TsaB n=1 Tax=Pseudoalteromonas sp. NBT06-2 TaxID=2025950 RepID=UPI000BA6F614|nr:tRNA (adenosine(37)-N6)-threonylcarbamoyltransferase complex dimerization subunit type 1 TsaB [Pseudoalteromonas sp. NBT06-2]PAJ76342.1 tRNA (adenosine(37)-N6)-threonylcarbamoyltransferase complex dimerization subunit type 1 TsaB [Pseudoalteromonas sp. NBT06-2]